PYDVALLEGPTEAAGLRPALPGGGPALSRPVPRRNTGAAIGGAAIAGAAIGGVAVAGAATGTANGAGLFVKHTGPVGAPPAGFLAVKPRAEAPVATVNGLPRRRPGTAAASQAAFPDAPESVTPMDPDEVRSRLSSFADGVAAAARRTGSTGA